MRIQNDLLLLPHGPDAAVHAQHSILVHSLGCLLQPKPHSRGASGQTHSLVSRAQAQVLQVKHLVQLAVQFQTVLL